MNDSLRGALPGSSAADTAAPTTALTGTFLPTSPGLRFTWTEHALGTDLVLRAQRCTATLDEGARFADGSRSAVVHTCARTGVGVVPDVVFVDGSGSATLTVTTTHLGWDGVVSESLARRITPQG